MLGMLGLGRRRAKMAGAMLAAGVASWAGVAGAWGLSLPNLNHPFAGADDQRSELPDRGHMSRTSVALFDYDHTWGGTEIEGGPMWWPPRGHEFDPTKGGSCRSAR